MDIIEAIKTRHSVRSYAGSAIDEITIKELETEIESCNKESGLSIQLIKNEPKAFDSKMAHYGKFSGVSNYVALIGKKSDKLQELCGYYGEKIVLKAQMLGLNSCWVALTYKKIPDVYNIGDGEKLVLVIAIGYGKTQGSGHKSKGPEKVSKSYANAPEWFKTGVDFALLAPTAINQQKFTFELDGDGKVLAKAKLAFYSKVDLGIAKLHFEIGSNKGHDIWAETSAKK